MHVRGKDGSSFGCPEDGVVEEGSEGGVLEELGVVAHEDVYVAGFHVLVCPYDGMVAHLDFAVGLIGIFIDTGEHMNIGPRRFVPRVPLFVFNGESGRNAAEDGVLGSFVAHSGRGESSNVLRPADASHEAREPGPDGVAVKFAQEGSVMEANPTDGARFNGMFEGGGSLRLPGIGWVVELKEQLVVGKIGIVDLVGVFDVVDSEVVASSFFGEPDLGGVDERLVDAAGFGDGENMESGRCNLGSECRQAEKSEEDQGCQGADAGIEASRHEDSEIRKEVMRGERYTENVGGLTRYLVNNI